MAATPLADPITESNSPAPAPPESPMSNAPSDNAQDPVQAQPRPVIVYTRAQLVHLSKSPLVGPPKGMPDLKEWFGSDSDHAHKRDPEPTTPNRERRFRRDQDDGETSSRPSFRSGLSQPSQMGNFKHHSLRNSDREDRDTNERLRNLSDKFDRDRLGLGLRGKDRDAAPHLSNRLGTGSSSTIASRRADARDSGKKKNGESNEDWRSKGSERNERPRSRARDASRSRRDPSSSRRDRDREDRKRSDRDNDEEDPRRWRDDGKRDERIARRDRGQREKDKDDSRWNTVEDSRDSRNRRNGREKREKDGGKETEERRDRDRDQKEPAWMETYVPTDDAVGILGGSTEGQLDGIQAWKKGVQEKEQKEKEKHKAPAPPETNGEKLDEIQFFRSLMEKEQKKPNESADGPPPGLMADPAIAVLSNPTLAPVLNPSIAEKPDIPSAPTPPAGPPQSLLSLFGSEKPPSPAVNGSSSSSELPAKSRFFPKPLQQPKFADSPVDPAVLRSSSPHTPGNAPISRLPPLGRPPSVPSPAMEHPPPIQVLHSNQAQLDFSPSNFTPFEEARLHNLQMQQQSRLAQNQDDFMVLESRRPQDRSNLILGEPPLGLNEPMQGGSRYVKYFDGRTREHIARNGGAIGGAPGRNDMVGSRPIPSDHHAMDDIFKILNNGAQNPRLGPPSVSGLTDDLRRLSTGPQFQGHHMSNQPSLPPHQPPPNNQLESFYDSRLDDRSFVPDGLVPGLRTAPPPRDRLYQEALDDQVRFNNRIAAPRGIDPMGGAAFPPVRNVNIPMNQGQFRGGPSPLMQNGGQQRLPPGLANLGGRPPHDTSLLGMQGLHGPPGGGSPQQFNSIHGFNGPIRGPAPGGQLGGLGPHPSNPNHIDLRLANQQQQHLLAMGGSNPNLRGSPSGFGPQNGFVHPHDVRRSSQGLPPHLLAQQQQGLPLGPPQHGMVNNGGASQDLMAILLNGQPH